jgi:pimeloyl-ACP methyl ester carboxylesterase
MKNLSLLATAVLALAACQPPDIPPMEEKVTYRELSAHPGYTRAGLTAYTPAEIAGFAGSAKQYPFPSGVSENAQKPIVLLFHGNSSTPADFETNVEDPAQLPQLSERLAAAGFRTYAIDFRMDKVDDPATNNTTENAAKNFDHGWAVPLASQFIDSVLKANPDRKISLVGFSLGVTIIRDAVRRLAVADSQVLSRIQDMVLAAGANHGVSTYRTLCGSNPTMRGRVACELGDRTAYTPTDFLALINGPDGAWETPCADGDSAYGVKGACGGRTIQYTTIVMRDENQGVFQDEFVNEASAALKGADNRKIELTDEDISKYFYNGLFNDHFGALRSEAALTIAMAALNN